MKCKQLALRVLSTAAVLSIVSSIAAPVFAETYYIGNGHDLNIDARADGKVYVNDHEDRDGEITIKGSAGEDSLTKEKKEQETGENSRAEKQTVTEETPGEKTSAEEGETKEQDTPSEIDDEGKESANEKKEDDVPAAEENAQPEDTAKPEDRTVKNESASSGENARAALQSAPEENTSVENSPVSNVIKVVNNWAEKTLKITLDNVNIKTENKSTAAAMGVSGSGDTEINLKGQNTLDSRGSYSSGMNGCAGLEKADTIDPNGNETGNGGKLIITASDNEQSLTALGSDFAAGIGGHSNGKNPSHARVTGIEINGGTIVAQGGQSGAGIGGGSITAGEVTINDGNVTAIGGEQGFGIGSGKFARGSDVRINGGNITASSTVGAAGIGGTYSKVTITDGTIRATGGKGTTGLVGGGAGIGGYGTSVAITGGNVTATGSEGGAGIGHPGGTRDGIVPGTIEISGTAEVTATGGAAVNGSGYSYSAGASIGNGGIQNSDVKGEEVEVVIDNSTTATIVRNPVGGTSADHQHNWAVTGHEDATTERPGKTVYHCDCGADRTDYSPALPTPEPDNGANSGTGSGANSEAGYAPLTVLGADSFEQTTENDCLIITVPEENATLTGSLAALRELESSGIRTLVFRTRHCESRIRLADLTAQGSDETVFVLSHSGENASLTLGGRDVTNLLA